MISAGKSSPTARKRWLQALGSLRTWQSGRERAVHKPLLTLLLLGRASRGAPAKVRFDEIAGDLERLLRQFGPRRKIYHPEYPFWHLRNDGFWVIEKADDLTVHPGGASPTAHTLRERAVQGRIPDELWQAILEDDALREQLTQKLLTNFWPATLHEAIRQEVGLPEETRDGEELRRRSRDPRFREAVLRAYERRCAVCGYDGRLADTPFALEAAHIRWHACSGPDSIDNALALCSLHHVALDTGAIGISKGLELLVSCDVTGGGTVKETLLRYVGSRIRPPQSRFARPSERYLSWHRKQVFKSPAR